MYSLLEARYNLSIITGDEPYITYVGMYNLGYIEVRGNFYLYTTPCFPADHHDPE